MKKIEKSGDDSGSQYVCNDGADDPGHMQHRRM